MRGNPAMKTLPARHHRTRMCHQPPLASRMRPDTTAPARTRTNSAAESVVMTSAGALIGAGIKAAIDEYLNTNKKVEALKDKFNEMGQGTTKDIAEIKGQLAIATKDIAITNKDIAEIKGQLTTATKDAAEIKGQLAIATKDIAITNKDIAEIKGQLTTATKDAAEIKGQLAALAVDSNNISNIKDRLEEVLTIIKKS